MGFLSPVTWRQHFKSHFGVSPAEWRKTAASREAALALHAQGHYQLVTDEEN